MGINARAVLMDKLKIIKLLVFVLTFCTFFVLCLILTKIMLKSEQGTDFYTINLETTSSDKVFDVLSDGKRLYVTTDSKIHVIDMRDKVYEGVVVFK